MSIENTFSKGMQYEIYIGIKDKDSYEEIITVEDFEKILSEVCYEKKTCFSLQTQFGGYEHNKGYTTETSLRIIVIGANEEDMFELGERLKLKINTDTIMITRSEVEFMFF